jgi:hypothetical protein
VASQRLARLIEHGLIRRALFPQASLQGPRADHQSPGDGEGDTPLGNVEAMIEAVMTRGVY